MVKRIEWSDQAKKQLRAIKNYYTDQVNSTVANDLIKDLTDRVSILYQNPKAGPIEELLPDYSESFRYLVEGNYKIIYWINHDLITISSVFDCRQNPARMRVL